MSRMKNEKSKALLPLITLPLIFLVCFVLWLGLSAQRYVVVYSENGLWDLREFDFQNHNARLRGPVEFIPDSFVSPQEFAQREDEAVLGFVHEYADYATSRVRLLLPGDTFHTMSRISTDFFDRIFVNDVWLHDVGVFAENPDDIEPFTARVTFTVLPDENGVVEIVQQTSNMGQRGRGVFPQDWLVGGYGLYIDVMRADFSVNIVLGVYAALFLSSLSIFILVDRHNSNIYFALLCLMWFLRTAVTSSARVSAVLAPWLSGLTSMRIEYVAMPIAAILILAIIRDVFPDILHRYFVRAVIAVSTVISLIILFAAPAVIGLTILLAQVFYLLCFVFVIICFAARLRRPDMPQTVFAIGMLAFIYGAVRDFTYYSFPQFPLPPFTGTNLTQVTTLAFVFCQAIAVFVVTMKKVEESKKKEQEYSERNIALDGLNRMKAHYLANMSHEIKTPLAVILGDIQRVEWELKKQGFENERVVQSISRSQSEVNRIARLTESAIKMSAMQESNEKMKPLDAALLFITGIEAYRSLIEKQGNALNVFVDENLPMVFGNSDQLIGVLSNLLTNANKHTKNGQITVSIKSFDNFVYVTVADTGLGIAADLLPKIFERGISGSGSTGMGLAISKHTIESHGGTIEVKSKLNAGTTAVFGIPAYKDDKAVKDDA